MGTNYEQGVQDKRVEVKEYVKFAARISKANKDTLLFQFQNNNKDSVLFGYPSGKRYQ